MPTKKKSIDSSTIKAQFGKYKGRLVSWIVQNDPSYAEWLARKSNSRTKSKRAAQSLIDKNKEEQ